MKRRRSAATLAQVHHIVSRCPGFKWDNKGTRAKPFFSGRCANCAQWRGDHPPEKRPTNLNKWCKAQGGHWFPLEQRTCMRCGIPKNAKKYTRPTY